MAKQSPCNGGSETLKIGEVVFIPRFLLLLDDFEVGETFVLDFLFVFAMGKALVEDFVFEESLVLLTRCFVLTEDLKGITPCFRSNRRFIAHDWSWEAGMLSCLMCLDRCTM